MSFVQLIRPNLHARANAGNCLVMVQNITGAPVMHESATIAARSTQHRHYSREMPNTIAVLWFEHYGTYGSPREYKNWGHTVVWVPGRGFASSSPNPGEYNNAGTGGPIYWYPTIEAVEKTFNARFLFWSEDVNTLRVTMPSPVEVSSVSKPSPKPDTETDIEMKYSGFYYEIPGEKTVVYIILCAGSGFYTDFGNGAGNGPIKSEYVNAVAKAFNTGSFAKITRAHAENLKKSCADVRASRA